MKKAIFSLFLCAASLFAGSKMENGATLLEQISKAFTELANQAKPATVSVKCKIQTTQAPLNNPFNMYGDDFFERFLGPQYRQQPQEQVSGGSGFLISSDGFIVTNHHVIKDATEITITLNDGREFTGTIKGSDARTDLAVLKIDETNLPFLQFGNSDELNVGEWVVAVGNPFGLEGTITQGIVSAKGRQDLGIAAYEDFIQTDAVINPGNSGGPLLNVHGEVVGVNTAILSKSGGFMGVGLAIPSQMVRPVIDQIVEGGVVQRAYIGVVLQPIDKELSQALHLDQTEGILISDVVKTSPAEEAGLQSGDIILSIDGRPVKRVNSFRNEVAMMSPGTKITLKILRNHKTKTIALILGKQNEGKEISMELTKKLGIELENLTPELRARLNYSSDVKGVVISRVNPGSSAALAGLRPGFLITAIALDSSAQTPIETTADFDAALEDLGDRKYVILIVRHQNFQRFYTVKVK